jgi:hypothetical protein
MRSLTNERLYRIAHQGYDTHSVSSAASYVLLIDRRLIQMWGYRQNPAARHVPRCPKRSMVELFLFVHLKVGRQVLYVRWKRTQLIKNSGSKW